MYIVEVRAADDECVLNRRLYTTDWIHVLRDTGWLTDTLRPTAPTEHRNMYDDESDGSETIRNMKAITQSGVRATETANGKQEN